MTATVAHLHTRVSSTRALICVSANVLYPNYIMNRNDNQLICTELIRALSERAVWHGIVARVSLSSEEILRRVLTQPVNLGLDGSSLTIFNIAIPLTHVPPPATACLVELVRRRCFENETMTAAFAFRWRGFQMDSLAESIVDRCELSRQCLASRMVSRADVLGQLLAMASSDNYFVRCRASELRRSIQSSAMGS